MPKQNKNKQINLITEAGSSINNKTGSWRTEKPITDLATCVGCSLCAKLCPENCIVMKKNKKFANRLRPITDYNYCKGCGLCAHECPTKAIKMEKDY